MQIMQIRMLNITFISSPDEVLRKNLSTPNIRSEITETIDKTIETVSNIFLLAFLIVLSLPLYNFL